nr:Pycsar system effector family protein [[Eubacterium] tenue]
MKILKILKKYKIIKQKNKYERRFSVNDKKDKIEDLYKRLEIVNTWIDNADSKISYVLTFIGVLFGFFTGIKGTSDISAILKVIYFKGASSIAFNKHLLLILFIIFIITSIISMVNLCKALKGSIDINVYEQKGLATSSNIFFQTIANSSYEDFSNSINNETENDIIKDITSQIYINSKICTTKFENYNKGLKFTIISVIIFFLYTILSYTVF